ncbi:putative F-box domain, leucine-rich repeat domain superfamily, F-box-like domain superfamily [Helianthus annuus]|nr:putative F-box domain, leucine-rich repeat domain superfamily, F-box-like domain superfamily [Helianthus annuus]KAJ0824533.1 putative F-box domain, leucine-rich repeat domain superfamily, F-box-like domain superfamily [Helianthus annuus]
MDSGHGKTRAKVEGDRLSNLPDDVIHKILSFIGIKQAVETSALSSRWRYVWTSMPYLNFLGNDFRSLRKFSTFVEHVLSARNNQTEVHSVELAFRGKVTQVFVKRILDYAFSYNVQKLNITFFRGKKNVFPLSLFNSQSLKHLTLTASIYDRSRMTQPVWELPALETLNLHYLTLYHDNTDKRVSLFSNCANLQNLTLKKCRLMGLNGFNICHPGLSSLTLEEPEDDCNCINVVTPQLKTLTITYWDGNVSISAPNLSSLCYKDRYGPLKLSADFLQLETVDICISSYSQDKEDAHEIVCMLQQIHSVKFLTLNLELIEVYFYWALMSSLSYNKEYPNLNLGHTLVIAKNIKKISTNKVNSFLTETLSSSVELISHQPSPFANLKRLKIYPSYVTRLAEDQMELQVTMCTEVKNYLLDASPGATFTVVSYDVCTS